MNDKNDTKYKIYLNFLLILIIVIIILYFDVSSIVLSSFNVNFGNYYDFNGFSWNLGGCINDDAIANTNRNTNANAIAKTKKIK